MAAGKYKMIALNIDPMNEKKEFSLDELFPYNEKMAASTGAGGADEIRTWDQENQQFRYYFMYFEEGKSGPVEKSYHWVESTSGYPYATEKLTTGSSVFYMAKKNNNSFSIPGQVPNEAVGVLKQGYNMIGVGFPSAWNPNDAGKEYWSDKNKFAMSTGPGGADEIRYWDAANDTYRYFFLYFEEGKSGPVEKSYQWVENLPAQSYPVLNESLETGEGFFYMRKKEGQIEFKPGLKL